MNYENGPSVPPTPGGYRTPSYAPHTPIPHQTQYEQQSTYQHQQEPFYGVYSTGVSKKKNTRASQACDQCRQLKAKCDETKPCKTCRDKGTECRYRDPVPKATDKAQADILEGIQSIQSTLTLLSEQFGNLDSRVSKMESVLIRSGGLSPPPKRKFSHDDDDEDDDDYKRQESPPAPHERPHHRHYIEDSSQDHPVMSTEIPISMMLDEEEEVEPGPPVPPGEPAIPINHTTLAGLLLNWDAIKELTADHLDRAGVRYISDYPIGQEQQRGMLKVYGRGEDFRGTKRDKDKELGKDTNSRDDHGSLDMSDDLSDIASSSPAADWGQLGGLSPGDQVIYQGGVLGADGNPDFTGDKIWSYTESFKTHILSMHPIIQPAVIDMWVQQFIAGLPAVTQNSVKPMVSKPTFAVSQSFSEMTGSKRKRSPMPDGSGSSSTAAASKSWRPNRSVHSAMVLVVLALGKICLHRKNVPDAVFSSDPLLQMTGSPVVRNGVPPSPTQGSPPSFPHSQSSGLPSPREHERGSQSRRSSIHGSSSIHTGFSLKKNFEAIPGLEYFALATDIIGNQLGSYNNMKAVYANIFAGLYHGQLARPLESFAYIHRAGHNLQVIMRSTLDRLRTIKQKGEFPIDTRSNNITLAFWTCLQLESDLIAELPLPPSGLLQYEDDMPPPNMSILPGFDQRVLDSYLGQLYLRKHLNSIHRMFYSPDDKNNMESDKFKNVRLVADAVSGMDWVPHSFRFQETDLPATDILSARLRAKYWGAQVITYRPFVRQILQWSFEKKHHPTSPHAVLSEFRGGIVAPHIPASTMLPTDLPPSLIELAHKGINALIESTRAFHGLGKERPIITNVFGTAHAQWGNMLVLTAAYKDPILNAFIDKSLLGELLDRTIYFLRQSATLTSTLRIDMLILEGLYFSLFPGGELTHNPDAITSLTSFTSASSAPTPMAAPPPVSYVVNDSAMAHSMPPQTHMGFPHGQ
ncbi:hypothetical protein PT974_11283 [Cladobotryum mycophilum]|uniref:Zn(2)-C6 fungal-type domain-containing protein n=1 Tax=Cladobotryum mycophilum TaxID=491253 RepID=A0ABR0S5V9_9HYPO